VVVKESLSLIGIRNLNDVLGSILADNSSLDRFTENSIVNSDYFPFVEFDMNRSQLIDNPSITWQNLKMMLQNTQRVDYKKLLSFEGLDSTACNTILNELNINKDANDYLLEKKMPAQFHAAANIRGGRGKTKTKEKIGANKTLHYGSGARKKNAWSFGIETARMLLLERSYRKPAGPNPTRQSDLTPPSPRRRGSYRKNLWL
jgi:hypothetical protein